MAATRVFAASVDAATTGAPPFIVSLWMTKKPRFFCSSLPSPWMEIRRFAPLRLDLAQDAGFAAANLPLGIGLDRKADQ